MRVDLRVKIASSSSYLQIWYLMQKMPVEAFEAARILYAQRLKDSC